jgi:hypothetical protein
LAFSCKGPGSAPPATRRRSSSSWRCRPRASPIRCRTGISCSASPRCSARTSATTAILLKDLCRVAHECLIESLRTSLGLPEASPASSWPFTPLASIWTSTSTCTRWWPTGCFGGLPHHARVRSQALGGTLPRMGDQVSGRQGVDAAPSGLGCVSGGGERHDRLGVVVGEGVVEARIEGRFARRVGAGMRPVAPECASRTPCSAAPSPGRPCLTSGPTFVTLRPWKRMLSAPESGRTPRRVKSDFLSVRGRGRRYALRRRTRGRGAQARPRRPARPRRAHRRRCAPRRTTTCCWRFIRSTSTAAWAMRRAPTPA